jgi:hypothetical protein
VPDRGRGGRVLSHHHPNASSGLETGTVSYLDVITVQTIALTDEVTAIQIRARRMAAAVLLVQAPGGGWTSGELPSSPDVTRREDPSARP